MPLPIVPLDAVPTAGLEVPLGPWAAAATEQAFGSPRVTGHLRVERHGVHLVVRGELAITMQVPCDRCMASISLSLAPTVACVYSPIDAVPERTEDDDAAGPALPESIEEVVDASEYDGVALNLADVVVESLQVEAPPRWVCADASPDNAGEDAACAERFRALGAAALDGSLSPFGALAGWKPKGS